MSIFTLYNLFFIASVHHMRHGNGMVPLYFLIVFQQFYGMPAHGRVTGVICLHHCLQLGNPVLYLFRIVQNILLHPLFVVMNNRMKQNVKTGTFCCRHWYHRNIAQKLRQAMHIYFHSTLFHDIHHVQSQHHRLPQFQKLQCQIQIPLQRGRIHHIDNYIYCIIHGALSCDFFFNGIAGQRVYSRRVHQCNPCIFIDRFPLKALHRDSRPIGHLQPGSCQGIEQCGFSAVGVPNTGYMNMFSQICPVPKIMTHAHSPLCERLPQY